MAMPVLATKLFVPPPRSHAVSRRRLVARLDDGLARGHRFTLISAPAGFGKTTVLSEWVAERRRADPELGVGWVSLDEGDNDPVRFLSYVVAALTEAAGLTGPPPGDLARTAESTLTTLVNDAARNTGRTLLVLDDFQLIEDASVRDAVIFLLDHAPPNLHLAIASRSDPLLPIARLRARNELTELRAADLRFAPDEAARFLTDATGLALSTADVAALEARTEGWIAGLQLAALSLRERPDASEFVAAFTGSNRFVIDYLIEEVLDRAPAHVREFLYQTAILERLSGPLCDAVTGDADGIEMLATLERANLFVVPLDDQRQWFRYHHLFADVLKVRLSAHGVAHVNALQSRASDWFERHGSPEEAVRHALAGSDFSRAARLIESAIPSVRKSRQDATLLGWLAQLPQSAIDARPVLRVFAAWASLVAGDIAAVEPQLAAAEAQLLSAQAGGGHESEPGEELNSLPVTIALYRGAVAMAVGDTTAVRAHAQRALDVAASDDYLGRGAAAGMLGLAAWARGDLEAGAAAFRESAANLRQAGNLLDALSTTMVVGDMLLALGRLAEAQAGYELALREANGNPPAADLHAGFSEVLRQRNELHATAEQLSTAEAVGSGWFSHEHRYRWALGMAALAQSQGEPDAGLDFLATADTQYRRGFFPDVRPIGGVRARVWITQGRFADARNWITEHGFSSSDELAYLSEFGHITLARLLLAEGRDDSVDEAESLLSRLALAAESGGRLGSLVEIRMLHALALHARGDATPALASFERALALAEPDGQLRLFLDEGAPVLHLLRAAAGAGTRPDFVRTLSRSLRNAGEIAPVVPLPDPLSDRELSVVRLLGTQLTGPEIARELHVSVNTLRTHTKHIFVKLSVNDRAAAVRRAEALGLI
ncbi:LuxR family transcriptional regulator, maltose regulon positive regulatory protein [Microbacterium sp. cf046]|uniref:LuxR C-terminal-related transcriptional regulator n=1 Tax=Microbacterium sp. cf046 TaxID=1761803 RepID=UPI0008ECDCD3|nr:LuxR C-terminal-related transcriptional regulator [Microbacterium sp. cf046]SFR93222.1 LuxR family transcriptional regulator, maltose regulon positive regulatory protein [Microbacterium sp. cf046]